jgi:hypothetical protein
MLRRCYLFTLPFYIPSLLIEPIVVFPIRFRYITSINALLRTIVELLSPLAALL